MNERNKLSAEDEVVANAILEAGIFPLNKEMLKPFVHRYRELHPDEEDLEDALENVFKDAKCQNPETLDDTDLFNGYKKYTRLYFVLLPDIMDKSNPLYNIYDSLRISIYENEDAELVSDIIEALGDKSIDEAIPEEKRLTYSPMYAFFSCWSGFSFKNIEYPPNILGMLADKLWRTEQGIPLKFMLHRLKIQLCTNKQCYPLEDMMNHISDKEVKADVEQFFGKDQLTDMFSGILTAKECAIKKIDDISDDEFIEKIFNGDLINGMDIVTESWTADKINGRAKKLLKGREDLKDRILDLPDINLQINLLACIGTGKMHRVAWEEVVSKSVKTAGYYTHFFNVYGERFQMKYLRAEISKKNILCIYGAGTGGINNEMVARFIFAVLWNDVIMGNDKMLLEKIYIFSHEITGTSITHFPIDSSPPILYILYIHAMLLPNCLFSYTDTSMDHTCLMDIIFEMLPKNNIISTKLKSCPMLKTDHSQQNAKLIYSVLTSWSESGTVSTEDMNKYRSCITKNPESRIFIARTILNANFKIPEYSEKNEELLMQLLFLSKYFNLFMTDMAKKKNIPVEELNKKIAWKEYWQEVVIAELFEMYNQSPAAPVKMSLPIEPEYERYILSRIEEVFATAAETLMLQEFKRFIFEQRKTNIASLKKRGLFNDDEEEMLLKLIMTADHYALSDKEISQCCPSRKNDAAWWENIHTGLESELMTHVFDKCLLWVIKFDKSVLWEGAPWWGIKIFTNSFKDRLTLWAKHLFPLLDDESVKLEDMELRNVCYALGELRYPWPEKKNPSIGKIPMKLKQIADDTQDTELKEKILLQYRRFNRGNIEKGRYDNDDIRRINKCRKRLLAISQGRFNPRS